jgi:YD repeat-containing protein
MKRIVLAGVMFVSLLALAPSAFAGTTSYTYDEQGRLVLVQYPNGSSVSYTYDNAGNRTQTVVTP